MSQKKNILKTIKAPDLLQKKIARFINWLISHKAKVGGIAILFVAIYGGVLGFQYYRQNKNLILSSELATIDEIYDKEMETANSKRSEIAKQIEILEKLSSTATPENQKGEKSDSNKKGPSPSDLIATAKKKAELEKQQAEIKENHEESLKKYQEFYKTHPKDVVGAAAGFKASMILVKDQKFAEARTLFESVRRDFNQHPFYSVQSLLNLSAILEQEGSFDEGLKLLDEALAKAPKEIKPQVLLAKARLEYLSKQNAKAKNTIEEIVKNHGESEEAKKAKALKILIN